MSAFPGPANPIVYAQFIAQGGWRRMLIVAGTYGAMAGVVIWLSTLGHAVAASDMNACLGVIAGLQVMNLLLYGAVRVESGVRGDITSRMIESHRLMPASPLGCILGYLVGALLQPALLAAVNFLLGSICCHLGGLSSHDWTMLNAYLFFFAILVHSFIIQLSFLARGGFLLVLVAGFVLSSFGASGGLEVLPGIHLLFLPVLSRASVFAHMFSSRAPTSFALQIGYVCALVAQAILAAVAIRIAVRRYLSASAIGISPILGLIVLAVWVALAIAGFSLGSLDFYERELAPPVVCTIAAAMLLAMTPIASEARSAVQSTRHPEADLPPATTRFAFPATFIATAAVLGALLAGMALVLPARRNVAAQMAVTAAVMLNFLVAASCMFVRGYRERGRPWIIVIIWVALTWMGPVIVMVIYGVVANHDPTISPLIALSPPAALALVWSDSPTPVGPGIMGQVALTVIPAALLMLSRRRTLVGKF